MYFFKHYWLDIVAIFPFAFALNLVSRFIRIFAIGGGFVIGQAILHEGLEARKGIRALARAGRFARISARIIRVVTKSRLFSHFVKTDIRARKRKGSTRKAAHTRERKKREQKKVAKK